MSETTFNQTTLTTNTSDPWTESGYSNWQKDASSIRVAWMEMMGFSAEEIKEECAHNPPFDFDEELSQYNAMFAIQKRNG